MTFISVLSLRPGCQASGSKEVQSQKRKALRSVYPYLREGRLMFTSGKSQIKWLSLVGVLTILVPLLAACGAPAAPAPAQAPAATQAPGSNQAPAATQPPAATGTKVLRMSRQTEPFSPFIPWQIDDNPALFISVNV